MLLILDFLFAFFNFALSIRYYNHASYAINVPLKQDPIVAYETIADISITAAPIIPLVCAPITYLFLYCSGCLGRPGCWPVQSVF